MKMSIIISVWFMVMALIVVADSADPTWSVDSDSEEYSKFLDSLREELGRGTTKVCNLPVTNKNNNNVFVLVNLVLPFNGNTITLALRKSDAYLVGFQDTDAKTKKIRANFFSDEYARLNGNYKSVFPKAQDLGKALPLSSSYTDLEKKAGVSRENLNLGVSTLQTSINKVYGKDFNAKGEDIAKEVAKFALTSIQMVAEAARFKYIEDQVINRGMFGTFQAGSRITLLENNWSSISDQYHNPARKCIPQDSRFTAEEMKLGLLLYKGGSVLNSNDGHASFAFVEDGLASLL
ncbi:ribosome-inactivating protein lychnin-like [Silene latifolia]|uniref:ribosome-inactivating protein lychnin-like n=1 Tax=Silene latifolia TaxID=37657 RepID=UPI003D77B158